MLADYLVREKIFLNFEAKDYKQAVEKMLAASSEKGLPQIVDMFMKRESLMSTALGKGIALPRIVLDDKKKTELIIALSTKGINANGFDRSPVKIIFLLLFSKTDDHPSILGQCLRLLNDGALRTELLSCKTPDEVIIAIKEWEEE